MRAEIVEIYWVLITIIVVVTIILNFFKVAEGNFNPAQIIKRTIISMILLWTFDETINVIGTVTEAVISKIGGIENWQSTFLEAQKKLESKAPLLFKYRQLIIYILNIVCFLVSLIGYYVINVVINFVYTILYVLSPLLILAYIPESTSYITKNLYKGILNVCSWKILWSILGVLLFKLTTVPEIQQLDGLIMQALINLCIGISMLLIPFFANSLLSDGGSGMAAMMATVATSPVRRTVKGMPKKAINAIRPRRINNYSKMKSSNAVERPRPNLDNTKGNEKSLQLPPPRRTRNLEPRKPIEFNMEDNSINSNEQQ